MINWLVEQSLPLSLCLVLVLLFHGGLLRLLGARGAYVLWSIVPLMLLVSLMPKWQVAPVVAIETLETYSAFVQTVSAETRQLDFVFWGWFAGFIVIGCYLSVSHYRYMRWLSPQPASAMESIPSPCKAWCSDKVAAPVVTGLFRQKLILPMDFFQRYNREQRILILNHELYHLRRGDLYWNGMALCILLLFWFNPLLWLAFARFRRDQELSCDEWVLAGRAGSSRVAYGEALLLSAKEAARSTMTQLYYGEKSMMKERICQMRVATQKPLWRAIITGFVSVLVFSVCNASNIGNASEKTYDKGLPQNSQPAKRVQPRYPADALEYGIEGYAIVEFTITEEGRTKDIRVIESMDSEQRPTTVFDQTAIDAASKLGYRPRTIDGVPVETHRVRYKFSFALDKSN